MDNNWLELSYEDSLRNFWHYVDSIYVIGNIDGIYQASRVMCIVAKQLFKVYYNPIDDRFRLFEELNSEIKISNVWKNCENTKSLSIRLHVNQELINRIYRVDLIGKESCSLMFDQTNLKTL